jgi:hypothetical protein
MTMKTAGFSETSAKFYQTRRQETVVFMVTAVNPKSLDQGAGYAVAQLVEALC